MATFLIVMTIIGMVFEIAAQYFIKNKSSFWAILTYAQSVQWMNTSKRYIALYTAGWTFGIVLACLFGEFELASLWMISLIINLHGQDVAKKAMRADEATWGQFLKS